MRNDLNHSVPRNGNKEHRCTCGQLLAKITGSGIELKCKRCKRIEVIPWSAQESK